MRGLQMDYSKTVNLPETDFPMRANLPNREPGIQKKWEDDKIYNKIQNSRSSAKTYILHDGPPYANGHIHLGHALNKILKDITVKHKTMMGYKAPYVPGWDCHGLPIELQVTKKLGSKAKTIEKSELRTKCREHADKFVKIQMDEFKRLGVFGDYENPYKTMDKEYESTIAKKLGQLYEAGFIYKGKKPIYWCPSCETALAEAEVEYADHTSTSIYVKFKIDSKSIKIDGIDKDNCHAIIWTTTPWTLPANLAVCFHPSFEYSLYQFGDEYYLLADGLVDAFAEAINKKVDNKFPLTISQIEDLTVNHPFIKRKSKVIFGRHVTLEQGTGIVHTAPGHGMDDYIVGLEHGLEVFCPVDHRGCYTSDYPEMEGVHVFKANEKVLEIIKDNNTLITSDTIEHSYPHCWRCKKPLIFRATEQWFLGVDKNNLRSLAMETIDKTKWIPKWGESRFRSMVESRPDWCLSRQRSWGVPIPSFRCKACEENMMNTESILHFAEIAKTKSIDIWYTDDIKDLIPEGTKCKCGSSEFVKENDILDVWFDSGVSHFAVLDPRDDHSWPADLYLEGSDQHRGWFQASLWPSIALREQAPYKTVLTHGFVLDDKGKAMSKSIGNVIAPEKIINQYGADVLRLWVSSEDYRNDLKIGFDMIKQISDSYRKMRNSFKFLIGNLSDFDEAKHTAKYDDLSDIDKWILHKLFNLHKQVIKAYENFEFHLVYRRILNFCAVELSSIYFDISKDILYTEAKDSPKRRASQTAINEIHKTLVHLIAPILAFTSEEIWAFEGNNDSIHMQEYYNPAENLNNDALATKIDNIVDVKKDVLKALEISRKEKVISSAAEAHITIYIKSETVRNQLKEMGDNMTKFFQVAKITISETESNELTQYDNSSLKIEPSGYNKCTRCWNFFEKLGKSSDHPELCDRCTDVITAL
jgi:isoleucyl-tRNA synthetase